MTLRTRITAFAAATVLVVLTLTGLAVLSAHERLLLESVDESLELTAAEVLRAPEQPVLVVPGDDDSVAQLVDGDRVVDIAGPAPRERPLAAAPAPGETVIHSVALDVLDDATFRLLSTRLDDGRALHLGVPLDDVHDSRAALLVALLTIGPLSAALLAGLSWWFVGRTLRPVAAMQAEVSSIRGGDLHRRVALPHADDEIGRLGRTLNDMLDRLERADEQQRRFVADASHELRTPLTRIRSELEVDLAHPETADLLATHRSALEEVEGLQRLVDDLLALARHDAPRPPGGVTVVELDALVGRAVAATPRPPGVHVDTTGVEAAHIAGHAGSLQRAVANLLDNAARHARSTVWVSSHASGDRARVVVADDGPGVPAAQRQAVFERFTRLDEARTDGGSGLGLAIVSAVVTAHDGTVTLDERPGGGARATIDLPLASTPAG